MKNGNLTIMDGVRMGFGMFVVLPLIILAVILIFAVLIIPLALLTR